MKDKLYKIDGTIQEVEPKNGKDYQLDELYEMLVCELVERVVLPNNLCAIVDEEGWLKEGAKRNETANQAITEICGDDWDVCGNVLVCQLERFN